ncbi:hypothetical protein HRbin17_01550 [bacterium HR17]|uniref:Glycosyltransferase RgtA/B/C/D-like domain-containing protein n=1 Tax=Candidatus Fervidibacter japonicus TaxID=2035412 RepID=A0A2H5XCW0_9BACT|nr:hypothetical protein HRbin17_01550 [bacterium HR17]
MNAKTRTALIILTVLITWLPYLFGWFITPPGTRYFWLIYNPDDQNVHLMWARQAMEGAWRFSDLYTTEPHAGLFVHLYALVLGWFCRLTGLSLHLAYQLFRTLVAAFFLAVALRWGDELLPHSRARTAFAGLVAFSSGVGWLPVLLWWQGGQRPPVFFVDVSPELMMPEANSFLSLTVAPLAALGVALVLTVFLHLQTVCTAPDLRAAVRSAAIAACSGAVLANIHTYAAIPMLLAIVLWQVGDGVLTRSWRWRQRLTIAVACVPCLLVIVVQAVVFSRDVAFAQKAATPTLTPPWFVLLGSYGLVVAMAFAGLPVALRRVRDGERQWLLPLSWLLALLIAIHLPVSFQRKMIEGLHVALCWLAALAWGAWAQRHSLLRHRLALVTLIVATAPSHIAFFALNSHWLIHNNLLPERRLQPPYYLTEGHLRLMAWLERHAHRDDAVLCHPMLGNYLPVLTGRKVFVGHWAETLRFADKLRTAVAIWSGALPADQARQLFRRHRLRYALETEFERGATGGATALANYGSVVFQLGDDKVIRLGW